MPIFTTGARRAAIGAWIVAPFIGGTAALTIGASTGHTFGTEISTRADTTIALTLREGTNLSVALSPDGQSLAMDLQGVLWSIAVAGGAAQQLTDYFGDVRQPHWSPDGQQIVFQSYRTGYWHLWTVRRDGTGLRQLTSGADDHREPHWSPDGARIAFSSDRAGNYDVWELEVATGALRQHTTDAANDYNPAWSPDGRSLAFVSEREGSSSIWVRGADGRERQVARAAGRLAAPSWSPSGTQIVFQQLDAGETNLLLVGVAESAQTPRRISPAGEDVFPFRAAWVSPTELLYTADGRIKRRTTAGRAGREVPFTAQVTLVRDQYTRRVPGLDSRDPAPVQGILAPAVSPDGTRVLFGALSNLWMVTIGNPTPQRLTNDSFVALDAAWSPDGNRIAYVSDRDGGMRVWIRDMSGGSERRATNRTGEESSPAWAPDGNRLAFIDEESNIQVVDLASGQLRTVHDGRTPSSSPSWSADGRTIATSVLTPSSSRYREGVFEVMLVPVDGGEPRIYSPIPYISVATRGAASPLWSPDGMKLALIMGGNLWVQPVRRDGTPEGPPRRLTSELASSPTWTADSRSIVFMGMDRLKRVSLDDGNIQEIPVELTWRRELPTGRTVVHAGRLFDGRSERLRQNVDLVVEGHRIVAVQPHRDDQHTGTVVDASGLTVMPGLIEMHMHQGSSVDMGKAWLAYGITTVREVSSNPYDARERIESIQSGIRSGPRIFFTGSSMDGPRIFRPTVALDGGPQLELEMERAEALRYDLIKTYVRLPDLQQARITRLAHAQGIPVTSHEIFPAVSYGVDGVEHYTFTSRRGYSAKASLLMNEYQDIREILSRSRMEWAPTLMVQGGLNLLMSRDASFLDDPRFTTFFSPEQVASLREQASRAPARRPELERTMSNIMRSLKKVADAGGLIIAGTDQAPYAVTLHGELELLVEAGLTPYQALRAATATAAEVLAVPQHLGTLEAGKIADMIAVEGNPLTNIRDTRRLRWVMENGRTHTLESLLQRP